MEFYCKIKLILDNLICILCNNIIKLRHKLSQSKPKYSNFTMSVGSCSDFMEKIHFCYGRSVC